MNSLHSNELPECPNAGVQTVQMGVTSEIAFKSRSTVPDAPVSGKKLFLNVNGDLKLLAPDGSVTAIGGGAGGSGTDGREVEFQKSATHIQWRYVGDLTWTDLVLLSDLEGTAGAKGDKGDTGDVGPKGDTGDVGPKGDTGDVGPKGDTGDVGPKGDTGAAGSNGVNGRGYNLTFTSLNIGVSTGSKTLVLGSISQPSSSSNMVAATATAYATGSRVRLSASASNWIEGVLTIIPNMQGMYAWGLTVTKISGSGTYSTWNVSIAGEPGLDGVTSYTQLADKPTLGTAAATDATAYATAAQGAKADSALQPTALTPYRTASAQDAIDAGKAATIHTHLLSDIPGAAGFQPAPEYLEDRLSDVTVSNFDGRPATKFGLSTSGLYVSSVDGTPFPYTLSQSHPYLIEGAVEGAWAITVGPFDDLKAVSATSATYPWQATWPNGIVVAKTPVARLVGAPLAATAAEGTSAYAARADHVHPLPTPAAIGAAENINTPTDPVVRAAVELRTEEASNVLALKFSSENDSWQIFEPASFIDALGAHPATAILTTIVRAQIPEGDLFFYFDSSGSPYNDRPLYRTPSGYTLWFNSADATWNISETLLFFQSENILHTSDGDNTQFPWQSAWDFDIAPATLADYTQTAFQTWANKNDLLDLNNRFADLAPAAIGAATAEQGAKAETALQPTALTPYRTASAQDAIDAGKQPAGSYATLVGGLVPSAQLPSYVDDVLEYATPAAFPATGETGKIYVATGTGKIYRWSGSAYVEIVASPGSSDAVPEGSTNLYFTAARAVSALASTLASYATTTALNSAISGLASVYTTTTAVASQITAYGYQTASQVSSAISSALASYATTASVSAAISALVTGVSSVAGKTGAVALVKADVGLGSVDNTSDLSKPISTATQTALNGKANASHLHAIADVTGLQTALDGKQAAGSYAGFQPNPEYLADNVSGVTVSNFDGFGSSGNFARFNYAGGAGAYYQFGDNFIDQSGQSYGGVAGSWVILYAPSDADPTVLRVSTTSATYPWQATWPSGTVATKAQVARLVGTPLAATAAEGTSSYAARADHVHPFPTAAQIGAAPAGNYVTLDGTGKISSTLLPSYVDDVIEVANFAALPKFAYTISGSTAASVNGEYVITNTLYNGYPTYTAASLGNTLRRRSSSGVQPVSRWEIVSSGNVQRLLANYASNTPTDTSWPSSTAVVYSENAGQSGKIYVVLDTGKCYRWSGSSYIEISQSLELQDLQLPDSLASVNFNNRTLPKTGSLNGKNKYSFNDGWNFEVVWTGTNWRAAYTYPTDEEGDITVEFNSTGNTAYPWQATGWTNGGGVTRVGTYNAELAPAPLGADAYSGIGAKAAREDHVHPLPTPADIGAATSAQVSALVTGVSSVAGRTGAVTLAKADVGLGSVDNTSDLSKPVSTATQTALNGKANASHLHAIADVTGLQTALDGKQAAGSYAPATGISPSAVAGTAVITTDPRLSDARTPTAHKSSHSTGGADALTPSDIGAATSAQGAKADSALQPGAAISNISGLQAALDAKEPNISVLPVSKGGTGAADAATARANLGVSAGTPADIQIFTTSGTWTKLAEAKLLNVQLFAGGGGAGAGRKDTTSSVVRCGGGGGGGGSYINVTLPASLFAATESVTIGAGGAGGAAVTTNADGNNGLKGGDTIFSTLIAPGGNFGSGGTAAAGAGGSGALNSNGGGSASGNGGNGNAGTPTATTAANYGGAGGGAGGGVSNANAQAPGGTGGRSLALGLAGGALGNSATAGGAGISNTLATSGLFAVGSGGGGGGGGAAANGGNGGAGGFPSGGGGGGGATYQGTSSGAGGAGANGLAIITTYF